MPKICEDLPKALPRFLTIPSLNGNEIGSYHEKKAHKRPWYSSCHKHLTDREVGNTRIDNKRNTGGNDWPYRSCGCSECGRKRTAISSFLHCWDENSSSSRCCLLYTSDAA